MSEKAMSATKLLKQDHEKVKGLFKDFEELSDRAKARKLRLFQDIQMELQVHTKIEEEIFYPAAKAVDEELISEGLEEHHVVDVLLSELSQMDAGDEQFDAKMTVLQENVEHHVEEEEEKLFPEVEKKLKGDRLTELGDAMLQRKQELMSQSSAA